MLIVIRNKFVGNYIYALCATVHQRTIISNAYLDIFAKRNKHIYQDQWVLKKAQIIC